jgi:DNA-binding response OmpR family regulator
MRRTETILLVEDDTALLRGLKDNFEYEGYRVLTALDGEVGYDLATSENPDLIVLDLMIPRINGYEVCRSLREQGFENPIVMLTAKGEESDIILGLRLGADDYVTKPFSVKELLARVDAFLRRKRRTANSVSRFGEFELDASSHKLLRNGEEIPLTPKEYGLLRYLLENVGRALSREQILDAVWGRDLFVTDRSVDRCVTTLRNKIEKDPRRPEFLQTLRSVGYRFEVD